MLSRILAILGLIVMLGGALDPLEGSVVILPGIGLTLLGAFLGRSRFTRWLLWALAMAVFGVAAMFAIGAFGGIGGRIGHSLWWGLFIVPYPLGFLLGLVVAILRLVEAFRRPSTQLA